MIAIVYTCTHACIPRQTRQS